MTEGEGTRATNELPLPLIATSRSFRARLRHVMTTNAYRRMLPVVLFLVCFVAYRWGVLLALSDLVLHSELAAEFHRWQTDSGGLITDRVQSNLQDGPFSHELSMGDAGTYTSQVGLGGWLLSLISSAVGGGDFGESLMTTVVVAVSAAIAAGAVLAARRLFSSGAAGLVLLAVLQPFPTFFAASTYWLIGLKLLPAILAVVVVSRRAPKPLVLAGWLAVVMVPVLLSGYEFVTMIVALPLAVLTFFALRDGWSVRASLARIGGVLLGSLSALVVALLIHFAQLAVKFGSAGAGVDALVEVIVKRTGAGETVVPQVYAESLASSPLLVLNTYLSMPVFGAPSYVPTPGFVGLPSLISVGALILVCGALIIWRSAATAVVAPPVLARWQAAGGAWLVGLLGPVGWILLARPHSYIHTFINPMLWYLPTIPLGLALLWDPLVAGLRGIRRRPLMAVVVVGVALTVVVCLAYSYLSRR